MTDTHRIKYIPTLQAIENVYAAAPIVTEANRMAAPAIARNRAAFRRAIEAHDAELVEATKAQQLAATREGLDELLESVHGAHLSMRHIPGSHTPCECGQSGEESYFEHLNRVIAEALLAEGGPLHDRRAVARAAWQEGALTEAERIRQAERGYESERVNPYDEETP